MNIRQAIPEIMLTEDHPGYRPQVGRSRSASPQFRCALLVLSGIAWPCIAVAQAPCPRGTLPAYSHNDYENERPLDDALSLGFRGVEVDVFLIEGHLRVGHDRRMARSGATFDSLYLRPLSALAARCGALTDGNPFLLNIEIKERSQAAYDSLLTLLDRYRPMLARRDGRQVIEIVLVGWHPRAISATDSMFAFQYRLDRPEQLCDRMLDPRVRLLSLDYGKTMGRRWMTTSGRRRWLAAIRATKNGTRARLLRVHNVPPDSSIYAALLRAGVDLIGTTNAAATHSLLAPGT